LPDTADLPTWFTQRRDSRHDSHATNAAHKSLLADLRAVAAVAEIRERVLRRYHAAQGMRDHSGAGDWDWGREGEEGEGSSGRREEVRVRRSSRGVMAIVRKKRRRQRRGLSTHAAAPRQWS
jgi:hypothetical protein